MPAVKTRVQELEAELVKTLTPIRDIAQAAEKAGRDLTPEERDQVMAGTEAGKKIAFELKQARADAGALDTFKSLADGIDWDPQEQHDGPTAGEKARGGALWTPKSRLETVGSAFVKSGIYTDLQKSAQYGDRFGDKQRVQSAAFGIKSLFTGLSDTSAGALIEPQNIGIQVGLDAFKRPLNIRDLVTNGTTDTDTIEYVRVTSTTNNAAPVPEATSTAAPTAPGGAGALVLNAGGGYKPESGMTLQKISTTVKTLAHWIPATRRALADAGQVRTLIDEFLRYGLAEELEDQIMNGDGTGENFEGLENVTGTQTQAWDTDAFVTTRKAKTKVRRIGRTRPTAYVMNPETWEEIDLLKDNEGRYYGNGPRAEGPNTLWGLPVVESEVIAPGKAWVANWRRAVVWDRQQASIQATDSHSDWFVRNLIAILGESRHAFGVLQPNAFVEIDLDAA